MALKLAFIVYILVIITNSASRYEGHFINIAQGGSTAKRKMVLYADDTKILVPNKNKESLNTINHGYDAVRGMVIKQ
jgi:hypothetical protein